MGYNRKYILEANKRYARKFSEIAGLGGEPKRRLAILTCMDARLDPLRFLGLKPGDANIIRNAGGRASEDAIRSLVISNLYLGSNDWIVIHHTDCGMENVKQEEIGRLIKETLNTSEGEYMNWLTITDRIQNLKDDVDYIRKHPLVSKDITVSGYIVDVMTGKLDEIVKD